MRCPYSLVMSDLLFNRLLCVCGSFCHSAKNIALSKWLLLFCLLASLEYIWVLGHSKTAWTHLNECSAKQCDKNLQWKTSKVLHVLEIFHKVQSCLNSFTLIEILMLFVCNIFIITFTRRHKLNLLLFVVILNWRPKNCVACNTLFYQVVLHYTDNETINRPVISCLIGSNRHTWYITYTAHKISYYLTPVWPIAKTLHNLHNSHFQYVILWKIWHALSNL